MCMFYHPVLDVCFTFHVCQLPMIATAPGSHKRGPLLNLRLGRFGDRRFVRCNSNVKFALLYSEMDKPALHNAPNDWTQIVLSPLVKQNLSIASSFDSVIVVHHAVRCGLLDTPLFVNGLVISIILPALFCAPHLNS